MGLQQRCLGAALLLCFAGLMTSFCASAFTRRTQRIRAFRLTPGCRILAPRRAHEIAEGAAEDGS